MATEGKRAESLGRTFDSLRADRVLAPWLIHWLAYLQLARDTVIRHSVMSQCYKYSHAFPTNFSVLSHPSRELSAEVVSMQFSVSPLYIA